MFRVFCCVQPSFSALLAALVLSVTRQSQPEGLNTTVILQAWNVLTDSILGANQPTRTGQIWSSERRSRLDLGIINL